ncbi:hypothetical protein bsdE14_25990 [Clostridium omnivorum]|uniref:HNH endonuclease n=2 Tax=Clostridium omnivorum TaxID=1604902 RepID=A0ABQ5N7K9_9CLOT|nr:hypothetical protein bsdE14_25990 [Clostridium sp. E14]
MYCQACKIRQVEVIEKCDDEIQPYELCNECHKRLLSYSLRPIEWYNLASIHTFNKFLLHDDFYEDDGVATQPEEDVEGIEDLIAPSLDDVKENIESLIDFCIAKWWLEGNMINCLKQHEPHILFKSIKSRFDNSENYYVKGRLYEIASRILGRFCEDWIREKWKFYDGKHIIHLSEAACFCLPFDEGFNFVLSALENISDNELPHMAFSCLYKFRAPQAINWMETKVKSPVKDSWGSLAAASNPSWDKLNEWILKGRPYSLVAIDTLNRLIPHPGHIALNRLNPRPVLINPSSIELMSQVLKEYSEKDNVPRVKQAVDKIISNWNIILGE